MTPTHHGPVTDDEGRVLDQIQLRGLEARGYHGVYEHERDEGQIFRADVTVHLDNRPAARSDDVADAVDYSVLAEQVVAVLAGEPADLVETVAERIAAVALAWPAVHAVDVAVHKPHAPMLLAFQDVVVTVRRDRRHRPVVGTEHAPSQVPSAATPDGPAEALSVPVLEPLAAAPAPEGLAPELPSPGTGAAVAAPVPPVPAWAPVRAPEPTEPADDVVESAAPVEREPDRLDERPDSPVEVVLALGSNLGDSPEVLRSAVAALASVPGLEVHEVSPLARTVAVGGPDGQPDYLNAVVLARTTLAPRELLATAHGIEEQHGRERTEHWGPRTLDIDIIQFGSVLAVTDDLELPHPRAHERAFVLQPWAEIDPDAVLAGLGGGPVEALAATAPDRDGLRWLALDWLTGPVREPR